MTAANHADSQTGQLRVLHVEDNELDAELVAEALRRGGFSVSVAVVQAAAEFEQQLRSQRPDVVIADYNLPQWKGMEALDVLRRQGLDIPLILVSGALGDVTAVECIKAGATDYVLKDGLVRLPEAVRRALREKHLREQHRRSEELFRRAVESSPSGIVMVDELCKILLVNTETERLFGYGRDQLVGQPVEMLVPGRFHKVYSEQRATYHRAPAKRVLGERGELYARRQDGSEFPVEIGLNPIETTSSGTQTLISVVDITARKQAESAALEYTRELQRSNAELEQFAYIASHDLQEPLRMVASYTELLAERYRGKLDERADKYIGYAVDGARRMQRLIHDLLAYARVSSQAKPLQPTDTAVLLASVVAMMSKTIENSKAEVVSENMPTVSADELQLGQVFQNLLGNALKFRGERAPRIQFQAESIENGNMWRFSVADNGIGIDKENGGRLFQMFQRLHTREEYEGTGIGLAISKRIVERHAGRIWFDSAPGQGTTFYFTLPRPERCAG
jgi:PAS domain S-box-containing protein